MQAMIFVLDAVPTPAHWLAQYLYDVMLGQRTATNFTVIMQSQGLLLLFTSITGTIWSALTPERVLTT